MPKIPSAYSGNGRVVRADGAGHIMVEAPRHLIKAPTAQIRRQQAR